jgi:hypothetical protein
MLNSLAAVMVAEASTSEAGRPASDRNTNSSDWNLQSSSAVAAAAALAAAEVPAGRYCAFCGQHHLEHHREHHREHAAKQPDIYTC